MKSIICALTVLLSFQFVSAQTGKFSMSVSQDTILLGHSFEVKYEIENLNGKFEAPDLTKFNIIGGPNTSTNMSYINGEMTQSRSYAYQLLPSEIGVYTLMPAFLYVGEEVMETAPLDVIVLPNPEGVSQSAKARNGKSIDQQIKINQAPKDTISKPKRVRKKF